MLDSRAASIYHKSTEEKLFQRAPGFKSNSRAIRKRATGSIWFSGNNF